MASRYSEYRLMSYCFSPRVIVRDGEKYTVPCGKCDGCLLHRSNLWSSRLQQEIEANPFSIFGTLTYNNKFLPTLKRVELHDGTGCSCWFSDHDDNIRFDGKRVVKRCDGISVIGQSSSIPIQNDSRTDVINYASKRDIQLWLKLVRKDLTENFYDSGNFFRYFVVSEVGPTTLRNHEHFLIFVKDKEIADYLVKTSLYQNWQMCDETLFKLHLSYCDGGTARYVANYVNSYSRLPKIYHHRELRPFRLSSKSPAIGYCTYDKKEIEESYIEGDGTYVRKVSNAKQNHILCYSSEYLRSVFPKCYRFGELSPSGLLYVYGYLYRAIEGTGLSCLLLSSQLSKVSHVADWLAMKKCYDYCVEFGCTPFHYLYVLDLVYYKSAMRALRMQYEYLEAHSLNYVACIAMYSNLLDYVSNLDFLSDSEKLMLDYFFENFGIYDYSFMNREDFIYIDPDLPKYMREVSDIVSNLQKMPKYNELSGRSPHIV